MVLLSVKSIKGRRNYMEDRYAYIDQDNIIVAMVCDGHGGQQVAAETVQNLPQLLLDTVQHSYGSNLKCAQELQKIIMAWGARVLNRGSGSTLTGIVATDNCMFIYNIGDSRTCMQLDADTYVYMLRPHFDRKGQLMGIVDVDYLQNTFFCTADHDPSSPEEQQRIRHAGGTVVEGRVNGILNMTRSIGDHDVGPGLTYVPDIYWVKRSAVLGPVLMYSDGIYEPQKQTSVNFDDRYLYHVASRVGTEPLVEYAYKEGSEDNMTAMLVN